MRLSNILELYHGPDGEGGECRVFGAVPEHLLDGKREEKVLEKGRGNGRSRLGRSEGQGQQRATWSWVGIKCRVTCTCWKGGPRGKVKPDGRMGDRDCLRCGAVARKLAGVEPGNGRGTVSRRAQWPEARGREGAGQEFGLTGGW